MNTSEAKGFELFGLAGDRSRQWLGFSRYGYTPMTALADLIDNSIAAGATVVRIEFEDLVDSVRVYISDNGCGIPRERLKVALAIGSPEEIQNSRLSRFGFGMKTASIEISERGFHIISKTVGSRPLAASLLREDQVGVGELQARLWQEDHILPTWVDRLNQISETSGSGTVVIWEHADLKEADMYHGERGSKEKERTRIENRITRYLGMVFHRWLEGTNKEGRELQIYFGEERVIPWNPFNPDFMDESETGSPQEFYVKAGPSDVAVKLSPWVMAPTLSGRGKDDKEIRRNQNYQGIYLYRMDRLINEPDWFNLRPSKRNPLNGLRFSLDLDPALDDLVHLDVKKSQVDLPDSILEAIGPIVSRYANREEDKADKSTKDRNKQNTPQDLVRSLQKDFDELSEQIPNPVVDRITDVEVIVTGDDGTYPLHNRLYRKESSPEDIVLVDGHEITGFLYEPQLDKDMKLKILVNQDHDFYQKVWLKTQMESTIAAKGLYWLLYSFAKAEVATQHSDFKMQFDQMRQHVSIVLQHLSESTPLTDIAAEAKTSED